MQFSSLLLALSAAGALALNSFTTPIGNETLYAGETFIIRWNNTNGGETVDLLLKKGNASNLETALTISSNLNNVGAVRWFLPEEIVTGTDYALQIINKDNADDVNYSPFFTIIGQNVTSTSSSSTRASSTRSSTRASSSIVSSSTAANSTSAETTTTSAPASSTGVNSTVTSTGTTFRNSTSSGRATTSGSASRSASTSEGESTSTGAASGSASGSGAASSSASNSNGASFVSYSSLMLAGGIAGAVFMAL